jgi:penicillin-insensitive murein endopeptidase
MKILISLFVLLLGPTAFAQKEISISLPLRSGEQVSLSGNISENGRSTLTSPSYRNIVAESQTSGSLTVVDLYELGETGIQHSQYALNEGKLQLVREKKIGADESVGLFVGTPLSEAGRSLLGINRLLIGQDESPDERDARLAPWLDLKGGGIAVGPAQTVTVKKPDGTVENTYGSLETGTLLPASGEAFKRIGHAESNWGTGMMISMIDKASAEFALTHPGMLLYVGGISQEHGGFFLPHKSHQNGLDADITYLGTKNFDSQIGKDGKVLPTFETEKNWDFFRLLMSQRVFDKKEFPVVSMILVDPRIKAHYCEWAKAQQLSSPADMEILKRMRPTEGHDDHFHLRLRCSPHYALCLRQNYEPKETGCL